VRPFQRAEILNVVGTDAGTEQHSRDFLHSMEFSMITDRSEVMNTALVGVDAFAGALTRGSIGTIPETAETENTRSYQGGLQVARMADPSVAQTQ
jgi:hypothetical protein